VDQLVKDTVLVALDVESRQEAVCLADSLRGAVGGFKIGSRLFTAEGPAIVRPRSRQRRTWGCGWSTCTRAAARR
jgi:orotidine-5'-phosphate decarboxylase